MSKNIEDHLGVYFHYSNTKKMIIEQIYLYPELVLERVIFVPDTKKMMMMTLASEESVRNRFSM